MTSLKAIDKLDNHICDYLSRLKSSADLYCEDNGDEELIGIVRRDLEKLELINKYSNNMDIADAIKICNKLNEQEYVIIKESWGYSKLKFFNTKFDVEIMNNKLYGRRSGVCYTLPLNEFNKTWFLQNDNYQELTYEKDSEEMKNNEN